MVAMEDLLRRIAGVEATSGLAEVLDKRADIFEMTQESHDAALMPADPGGISHAERAALACRVARLTDAPDFATHYEDLMSKAGAVGTTARIVDLEFLGGDDTRLAALIRHVDLIANDPKSATGDAIEALKGAGISEPDIVRLSELVAFLSYQLRVAAGLKLMRVLT